MTLASKATLPHTFIMVVMFSKLNAYVGSETCSCTIPAKDTCHVQYLLAYGCKECLPCSKKPLLGGRRHHACRRFFPPERKTSPSRGRIIFLPREILPTRDTGKTGSHIVSIFRPCADEPFSEEPFMTSGDIPVAHIVSGETSVSERALPACTGSLPGWASAQRPWQSDTPGMIANRETPHGGISMHTMYDNREKSGRILALLEEKP